MTGPTLPPAHGSRRGLPQYRRDLIQYLSAAARAPLATAGRTVRVLALVGGSVALVAACAGTSSSRPPSTPGSAAATPMVLHAPSATPLASAPPAPIGNGTQAIITTPDGTITIELYTGSAPVAAQNFINLARAGYYNGVVFHRIVPGFVIQGGDGQYGREGSIDPTRIGTGGPGYTFPDEPFAGSYTRGTVAMANAGPNTNGSQFFIVLADAPQLPHAYTIFGHVVSGMSVVDKIAAGPRGGPQGDQALDPVPMLKVTITKP